MNGKRTMIAAGVAVLALGAPLTPRPLYDRASADEAPVIERYWPLEDRSVDPGDVEFKGSVRLSDVDERAISVVFLVDVSGSTYSPRGLDCNGDSVTDSRDDYNLDGSVGDVLDCEISAIASLNAEFRGFENMGSRIQVAIVAFGMGAGAASMTREGDKFVNPGHYEVDPNADDGSLELTPAFNTVASSLKRGVIGDYQYYYIGDGDTNFNLAVTVGLDLVEGAEGSSFLLMLSDGQASVSATTLAALEGASDKTKVRTFAVGSGSSCGSSLGSIAATSGEQCVTVRDPVQLTSGIGSTKPSYIDRVEVTYQGDTYRATVDAIGNWAATVPGVTVGEHTATVSVVYTDGQPPSRVHWAFTVKPRTFEHVALGDSYAAGEGNPPYIDQKKCTYRRGWGPFGWLEEDICMESKSDIDFMCHRSANSWPKLVYDDEYMRYLANEATWDGAAGEFSFRACSGATIGNFDIVKQAKQWTRGSRHGPLIHNELQLDALNPDVDLVTLSLGGNDAGFAPILGNCSVFDCMSRGFDATNIALKDWMKIRLALMNNELDGVYSAIRDRVGQATPVVVATYPQLFDGAGRNPLDCGPVNNYFSTDERSWVNGLSDTFAGIVWAQAPKSDFLVADTRWFFSGRGVCSSDPAVNGVMLGRDDEDFNDAGIAGMVGTESGSFHPNAKGIELYAQTVYSALRSFRSGSGSYEGVSSVRVSEIPEDSGEIDSGGDWFAGVVDDPEAVLAEYSSEVVEGVRATTFVELYADHRVTDAFDGVKCGAVVANEVVPLSVNGFAAGSTVAVTVTAATGADSPQEITQVGGLADSTGVLLHDLVLPEEIGANYVLVEVKGVNDQGGYAYGNTLLEATTDANCAQQAQDAGALRDSGNLDSADGHVGSDAATRLPDVVAADGKPAAAGSDPGALERTGASILPVATWGAMLVVGGFVLCLRHTRGRLSRRAGQHVRPVL
ncbi:MAG: GDSL-type esterase/lipase family protein [Bifidobacteriaceae bacterium]|jgi:lysophospholipase L1-like esterase|nr:GDSL-type esterase/lipase family protein [Bifidobacteriaceae bacterium]